MAELWVPAYRLVEIVDAHRKVWGGKDSATARRMVELRSGRQGFVSLNTADRILTELDLNWLLHVSREDGGLADIYVDGKQYGAPNRVKLADGRMGPRKYETEEERRAARARTYREAHRRRKLRKAA